MARLSAVYKRRVPLTAINTDSGTSQSFRFEVPSWWSAFWDAVDSSGHNVRITNSDGVTLIDHERQVWDYANRSATFDTAAITVEAGGSGAAARAHCLWFYWRPTSTQSDTSTTVAVPGETAHLFAVRPDAGYRFAGDPQTPNVARPRSRVSKTPDESIYVFVSAETALTRHRSQIFGSTRFVEPKALHIDVLNDSGASQSSMLDNELNRFVEYDRQLWLACYVTGGTDANVYTIQPQLTTVAPSGGSSHTTRVLPVGLTVTNNLET